MKELNKCYLIDNKYIIINYTSSKKLNMIMKRKLIELLMMDIIKLI